MTQRPLDQSPPGEELWTSASPDAASMMLVQLLTSNGAIVTAYSRDHITGYVPTKRSPSMVVAVLLFLICIIPAIIYVLNNSKVEEEPFSMVLVGEGGGTRVHINGRGRGWGAAMWAMDQVASGGSTVARSDEIAYDVEDWGSEGLAAVTAALDARDVAWHMEDGDLIIRSSHEALVDTVVLSLTGIETDAGDDDEDQLASSSGGQVDEHAFGATALEYTTDCWSPQQFDEITGMLDLEGIRWSVEDGFLLVAPASEDAVDRIIVSVTDEEPVARGLGSAWASPGEIGPVGLASDLPAPASPAGWYADPSGGAGLRWWDGTRWTDHLHDT